MTTIATILVHGQCGRGNLLNTPFGPCCTVCGAVDVPSHDEIVASLQAGETLTLGHDEMHAMMYAVVSA